MSYAGWSAHILRSLDVRRVHPQRTTSRAASRAPSPEHEEYDYDNGGDSGDSDVSGHLEGGDDDDPPGAARRVRSDAWEETFDRAIDDLGEKRLSIREKALNQLIDILAHHYIAEKLERSKETVVDLLKRCIKREKSSHENALGMRALALCFITLGPGQDALFQDLCFSLKYIITHTGAVELRVAGAITLAIACFVASEDAGDTYDLLGFFAQQLASPSTAAANQPDAQRAILNVLGLLLTSVDDMNYNMSGLEERRDTILLSLYDLANESSKRQSKKKRSAQKTVIRDVLNTIEDGEAPEVKLKFQNQIYTFNSWSQLRQLQIFREVLGEGLHVHFIENELLQDVFDFGGTAQLGSAMERLVLRQVNAPTSEISKERSRSLKKGRTHRMAALSVNAVSLHADDWDSP
ncbi:interferon-related developmental regulator-domain-containing protein [Syncephalis pseudoplumigaleata]|uniref:Interferon-related developmental regulator-domain-containing protein n=1 Tax=Syncephalis pseudoplumigaleata TaxID=1712513 RepID=A0A4P9YXX1_9FUNG|nr:interferon-related developmental regulator-domain-containing protein [Syncephalis pseudoplumigaleata]|eukprot:RKP24181.1 interferon-related developmental regulator-domain-containing protein [Syncephalis pseudoplumigaleata]